MFEGGLALAHLIAGRYEEAVELADRALHEQPKATHVLGFKAVACSHLGRIAEGCQCIRRFCELRPGSTIAGIEAARCSASRCLRSRIGRGCPPHWNTPPARPSSKPPVARSKHWTA